MKFLSIVILTLLSTSAFAQFKVTGIVRNSNNALIDGASVLLFKERDSILYKSAITKNQARFEFDAIEPGDYRLQISFTGFDGPSRRGRRRPPTSRTTAGSRASGASSVGFCSACTCATTALCRRRIAPRCCRSSTTA